MEIKLSILSNIQVLIDTLSKIKNPSFVRIYNYQNDEGEISNYTINMGVNYGNAKESDIGFLADTVNFVNGFKTPKTLVEQARIEMLASRMNPSNKRSIAQSDAYVTVASNIRVHRETGRVLIYGFVMSKDVLIAGVYKSVNSKPLTLAKKEIEEQLKTSKFRQFAFDKLQSVKVKGTEIIITLSLTV